MTICTALSSPKLIQLCSPKFSHALLETPLFALRVRPLQLDTIFLLALSLNFHRRALSTFPMHCLFTSFHVASDLNYFLQLLFGVCRYSFLSVSLKIEFVVSFSISLFLKRKSFFFFLGEKEKQWLTLFCLH